MAITRQRAIDHLKQSTVSEASRRDAKVVSDVRFGSFLDEWHYLVDQKSLIQRRLSETNRRASKDNLAIRAKYDNGPEGAREWLSVKGVIEKEQMQLVEELHAVEDRMRVIKKRVVEEKQKFARENDDVMKVKIEQNELLYLILEELKCIHMAILRRESDMPNIEMPNGEGCGCNDS